MAGRFGRLRELLSLRLSLVAVALALLIVGCAGCTSSPGPQSGARLIRTLDPLAPGWGVTHTQYTANDGTDASTASAEQVLGNVTMPQDQAIMGWGADNPEPSPGEYDFASLDSRMSLIRATGGLPVITLCCAPDWMKGGRAGQTDWSQLATAPLPAHYQDFADLAAAVARRYPYVRDYIVWNELKGFMGDGAGPWNVAGYVDLYNRVYKALKAVDPAILVGGPYVPMVSSRPGESAHSSALSGTWGTVDQRSLAAIGYWLANKTGADFIVVDGSSVTKEGDTPGGAFSAVQKFTAVSRWITTRTKLPLWWSEWYVEPPDSGWSESHRTAVQAAGMMALVHGGQSAALYWNPETTSAACPGCLWTSATLGSGKGGEPMPMSALLQGFARWFGPGTPLISTASPSSPVLVLEQPKEGVAVNTADTPATAHAAGRVLRLAPYQVVWFQR